MRIPEALDAALCLAMDLGAKDINKLPGCWEHQVDERWWIAFNAHEQEVECSAKVKVKPFTMYVQFNGWPAGFVGFRGGVIAAGEFANEDTFIEAMRKAARTIA